MTLQWSGSGDSFTGCEVRFSGGLGDTMTVPRARMEHEHDGARWRAYELQPNGPVLLGTGATLDEAKVLAELAT